MSAIDYDLKKIKAFAFDVDGVLSPSTIPLSSEGEPLRMVNIKDGYALQLAVKYGYEIAIITGGTSLAVKTRYEGLGITDIFQGSAKKLPVLTAWMESKGLEPDEVAYMGDDIPDLQAMRHIGLPCAPHDACTEAKQTAIYVSPFGGGYGCGRDLIEQVMKAQGVWMSDARAFGW
jgi:3-deoxy-D-manno-octulosonate 8-phosphate phosphatase (KDO 8-P phosphatase)